METSIIVFSGIVVCGIAAIPLILKGIHILFRDYMKYDEVQEDKQNKQEVSDAKDKLKIAADSGTLADLVNAAKELGDKKEEGLKKK